MVRSALVAGAKSVVGILLLVGGVLVNPMLLVAFIGFWWCLVFARRWKEGLRLRWIGMFPVLLALKAAMYTSYAAGFIAGWISRRG